MGFDSSTLFEQAAINIAIGFNRVGSLSPALRRGCGVPGKARLRCADAKCIPVVLEAEVAYLIDSCAVSHLQFL
jgi:hypothetical protein